MSRGRVSPSTTYPGRLPRTYTVTAQRDVDQRGEPVFTVCVVPGGSVLSTITCLTAATSPRLHDDRPPGGLENTRLITTLADIHDDFSCADSRREAADGSTRSARNVDTSYQTPMEARTSFTNTRSMNPAGAPHRIGSHNQNKVYVECSRPLRPPSMGASAWTHERSPSQCGANPASSTDEIGSSLFSDGFDWAAPTMERRPVYSKRSRTMSSSVEDLSVGYGEARNGWYEMDRLSGGKASPFISFSMVKSSLKAMTQQQLLWV